MVARYDRELRFDQGGLYRVSEAVADHGLPNLTAELDDQEDDSGTTTNWQSSTSSTRLHKSTLGITNRRTAFPGAYLTGPLDRERRRGLHRADQTPRIKFRKLLLLLCEGGHVSTISEETIRNDDLQKVAGIRIGSRAPAHTLAAGPINGQVRKPPKHDPERARGSTRRTTIWADGAIGCGARCQQAVGS